MREQAERRARAAITQWVQSFMPVSRKGVDKTYSIYMLYIMPTDKLKQLEKEILKIKNELWELAPMRPGSLSLQYKVPTEKKVLIISSATRIRCAAGLSMCERNGSMKSKDKLRFTSDSRD